MFATLSYLTFEEDTRFRGLEQRLFQLFEDSEVNGCEF